MGTRKPVKKPKASTHRSYYYRLSKRYRGDNEVVYNTLSDNLSVEDKKKGPYKKAIGYQKNGDPCHFEITKKNYIITVYDFKTNWRSWLKDQLTKHGLSKADAIKITKNLVRDISESHLVLGDIIVPPHLVGQKVRDKISGITIKFGDESHPDNLEIEVDHEVKQQLETLQERINEMSNKLDGHIELHKPKSKYSGLLTDKERRVVFEKTDKMIEKSFKDVRPIKVNDQSFYYEWAKEESLSYQLAKIFSSTYMISGWDYNEFWKDVNTLQKIYELASKGKIIRLKQP